MKHATGAIRGTLSSVALALMMLLLGGCAHLQQRPFTFVQMCDPQLGFDNYENDLERFKAAVSQINELQADFVVICGDLVHKPDEKSFTDFDAAREKLRVPDYCAPGNHDVGNEPTVESLKQFRKKIGKDYFYFDHKGYRFVILNTQLWKSPVAGETEKQDAWVAKTLNAGAKKGRPVFVVEHYPPFVKTANEPDAYFNLPLEKRKDLLARFEQCRVVAVLAGHTHTTSMNKADGIEVVTSETTSKNFDKRPFGFRVWHVNPDGTYRHEFVPLRWSGDMEVKRPVE